MTTITIVNMERKIDGLLQEQEDLMERAASVGERIAAFRLVLAECGDHAAMPEINLSGLPLEDALVEFAEHHNGELSTYQVRPALIDAGLLKGESRDISNQLYQALSGSRRFEQTGPRGRYRLLSMQREDDHEPETARMVMGMGMGIE